MRKTLIITAALLLPAGTGTGLIAAQAAQAATCTVTNGTCGAYDYSSIPMSNGYDTYVEAQQVGPNPGTADTITVSDPGSWTDTATDVPYGYTGVQMFDNVQQLTNDWNGTGWGGGSSDTPMSALSALAVNYSETSPAGVNSIYEFAPDVWTDNYGSDVMFWADTHGRCNAGAYGSTVLGTAVFGGQTWTVNRYGGPGAEIIFVLDSNPAIPDSCAQQSSGTIDILAGFQWLAAHGIIPALGMMSQLNTGWEITSADGTTFTMNSYSITATPAGSPSPSPSPSSTSPSPSPSSTSPSPSPSSTSPSPSPSSTSPSPSPSSTSPSPSPSPTCTPHKHHHCQPPSSSPH